MAEAAMQGMQEISKYPHGAFSWIDLMTTDVEAAKQFYGSLFGWTFEEWPMGDGMFYTFAKRYDRPIGGMMMGDPNGPAAWQSYVTVDNADAAVARVRELGGMVLQEPVDVFDNGRMVTFMDPAGGVLSGWQPFNFGGSAFRLGPGVPVWNELWTDDVPAALDFYSRLFGWTGAMQQDGDVSYAFCNNGEQPATVIMPNSAHPGESHPGWVVYFGSADVPADAAKVQELGGAVTYGPTEMGSYPFATCRDPQGAVFLLMGAPADQS